jgi:hypothetical protein
VVRLHLKRYCSLHQEIPEDNLSRVPAYDWFGPIAMVPLATALAAPAEAALGRTTALWGCSALVVVVTAAVLCVPDLRNLNRRTKPVAQGSPVAGVELRSADAEGTAGRLG